MRFEIGLDQGLKSYDKALDQAEEYVIEVGLSPKERPMTGGKYAEIPVLPPRLDELSLSDLQRYLGEFTEWFDYAVGRLRHAEVQRNASEEKRTLTWSIVRSSKEGTVDDKNNATQIDSRYVEVNSKLLTDRSIVHYISGITEGLKRDIETLSRSISALDSRINMTGRQSSIDRTYRGGRYKTSLSPEVYSSFRGNKR